MATKIFQLEKVSLGENHHRAKLTDHEVDLIRQLHEGGMVYRELADKFGVSIHTVGRICRFERRLGVASGEKRVHIQDREPG